ncbi:hypothetical protein BH11MYX3_BH11MYX3_29790 [soil metagenome]
MDRCPLRSRLVIVACLLVGTGTATAQEAPPPAPGPVMNPMDPPPATPAPPTAPDPTPDPTPAPTPDATPDATGEPPAKDVTPDAPPTETVTRRAVKDGGFVLGFEVGYGGASGTPSTVYGAGFGTGFVAGYQHGRIAVEWHFRHSYALKAKDAALRGETTQGELSSSAVLARVRVVDVPMVEVMAGPAVLNAPVLVVGEDNIGDQIVESRDLRGLGVIVGASIGYRIAPKFTIGLDLRTVLTARWELPAHVYVVPGDHTPEGGLMFTESHEDATARPWTATILMRVVL